MTVIVERLELSQVQSIITHTTSQYNIAAILTLDEKQWKKNIETSVLTFTNLVKGKQKCAHI